MWPLTFGRAVGRGGLRALGMLRLGCRSAAALGRAVGLAPSPSISESEEDRRIVGPWMTFRSGR
jgi:hypothetical protein